MSMLNLYDVLDVPHDATLKEIKKSYRMLVKKYHPDQPNGDEELFQLIFHAYNVLSNEKSRKEYDVQYSLSTESTKDHINLRNQSKNFYDIQKTSCLNKTKSEAEKDFSNIMDEMDRKRNFSRNKECKIKVNDAVRRMNDLDLLREQENIEFTHDKICDDDKLDMGKFNALWDKVHEKNDDIIKYDDNPKAFMGLDDSMDFMDISNYDELFANDERNEESNYSSSRFENKMRKLSKKEIENLKPAEYTTNHNMNDNDFDEIVKNKLNERKLENEIYQNKNYDDFDTELDCGGYGIFKDAGISAGKLMWDK